MYRRDTSDHIAMLLQTLEKKIESQQEQIEDLKRYKHDIFHKSQEKGEMIVFKIFKHIESVVPTNEMVVFQPVELTTGTYIMEATMTYINMSLATDAGAELGLYRVCREANRNDLVATGSAGWFGKVDGVDQYSASQMIAVKAIITVKERTETFEFFLKPIGVRNAIAAVNSPLYLCHLTIF